MLQRYFPLSDIDQLFWTAIMFHKTLHTSNHLLLKHCQTLQLRYILISIFQSTCKAKTSSRLSSGKSKSRYRASYNVHGLRNAQIASYNESKINACNRGTVRDPAADPRPAPVWMPCSRARAHNIPNDWSNHQIPFHESTANSSLKAIHINRCLLHPSRSLT